MGSPSPLARAAALIRADIKTAVADGTLPPYPAGAVIRVRSRRASLMTAIDIDVCGIPRPWAYTGGGEYTGLPVQPSRPTPANLLLRQALREIAGRHYEDNGSSSFISVHFHLDGED